MRQVSEEFKVKMRKVGAKQAADELGVCVASFYNYVRGKSLPRTEVLKTAQEKWGIKWDHLDPAEMLRTRKLQNVEQFVLPFLRSVRDQDIEIVEVEAGRDSCLRIMLKISFAS